MFEFLKKKEWCRISHFNIAFYAAVMWFGWLSLATHKLEEVYHTGTEISHYLVYFTLVFFLLVSIFYILKIFVNFKDVKADFSHSVKSNFFPWIGKIFLIFSIAFLSIDIEIAKYLWIFWVSWQFFFTVIIFRRWMLHEMDIKEMNPLWFLPIVWNMLAPVAWVKLGFVELSWFFFSIWIIMWAVLFTIIMNRIIFHNPLPAKLMPTLIILIAPPAVALLSITALHNWALLEIWKIFYYFALFMFLVIATKINIFAKLKFFMSWWAYSFPIAVLTTATILMYQKTWEYFLGCIWIILYIILISITLILIYKTIIWAKKKELCIEE
jgi:tellurite resistance protein